MKKKPDYYKWIGALAVVLLTVLFFLPTLQGDFLDWDDRVLLVSNENYRGLSLMHWRWMCTNMMLGHWQPLSWMSYALDYKIWELNPRGWHATNLIIHLVNAVLVYGLCLAFLRRRQSKKKDPADRNEAVAGEGCSAIAALAALFWAIHPLRVEVVAWLSTRGYLLCTTFCLLTVLFYLRAVERKRYPLAALLCFALATATKGIGMMLPLVLLLLDWFPLKRFGSEQKAAWKAVIYSSIEKISFFALSMVTGITAFLAKKTEGGMASVENYGFTERFVQAVYGGWFYLFKTVFPQNLSPLYYRPPGVWQIALVLTLTVAVAVTLFLFRKKLRPVLIAGGAFLLLIFPMIGITQSGAQLAADRFSYLSTVPFAVLVAVALMYVRGSLRRLVLMMAAGATVFFLGILALHQNLIWRNDLFLWRHAVGLDLLNSTANKNLAAACVTFQEPEEGVAAMKRAIEAAERVGDRKALGMAHDGLGLIYYAIQNHPLALEAFGRAIETDPQGDSGISALYNRALFYSKIGHFEKALADLDTALQNPKLKDGERLMSFLLRAKLHKVLGNQDRVVDDLQAMKILGGKSVQKKIDELILEEAENAKQGGKKKSPENSGDFQRLRR